MRLLSFLSLPGGLTGPAAVRDFFAGFRDWGLLALWLGWLGAAAGAEPEVRNVRAAQRAGTALVDVYYDLVGAGAPVTVEVAVSADGGASYAVAARTLSGAVGEGVVAGLNRHIVWNAGSDLADFVAPAMRVKVTARAGPGPAPDGFVLIPAGSFQMGDSFGEGWEGERPVHTVSVSAFYMGRTAVTKSQWDSVRGWAVVNGYTDLVPGGGNGPDHPVHSVSWYDVVKWCNARSEREGLPPVYRVNGTVYRTGERTPTIEYAAHGYRLPSEAEWEKAARGGLSGRRFPWGDTISHSQANYASWDGYSYDVSPTRGVHPAYQSGGSPFTSPVGSFASNGYGIYDMAGNVWQWCNDWWDGDYYVNSPGVDPRGPSSGGFRVYRGGAWYYDADYCRSACRSYSFGPYYRYYDVGFRLARSSGP
ncbi:MAG: formylglycine-generating enzyme family protein [Verrucomicrobiae bacterium]|nr:formylglycine-generating enzyme family protein [Verrucomicrobiae bacterium]